jgi:hypothetical protein
LNACKSGALSDLLSIVQFSGSLFMNIMAYPPWLFMWLLAFALFAGLNWLTWQRAAHEAVPWYAQAGYLLAWPGLDAAAFFEGKPSRPPSAWEWSFALAKTLLGIGLFWAGARQISADEIVLRGWVGLVGLVLLSHFGTFHLLSCLWRSAGRNARPLMHWPILATGVADFWGRRWNTAFRDVTHRFLFQPLTRRTGPVTGALAGFGISGLIHDLVISVPAGGGYGLPTLFFLFQGLALVAERSRAGRAAGLGRGWRGRLFALVVVAGPAYWLFHPPFVHNVVVPFMAALGAL